MKKISQRHRREWGTAFPDALAFLNDELGRCGFAGPDNLTEKYFFSFYTDPCDTIRARLAFSRFTLDSSEVGRFDSSIVLLSKTLHAKTTITDPWHAGAPSPDAIGYEPCYIERLSHRKWAERPGANPSWLMTAQPTVQDGVHCWLDDFKLLQMPMISWLSSDSALSDAIQGALEYRKPGWVKSDGPGFVWMKEKLAALLREPH